MQFCWRMASSVVADGFYARYSRSDAEYFNSVGMSILIKNLLVFVFPIGWVEDGSYDSIGTCAAVELLLQVLAMVK